MKNRNTQQKQIVLCAVRELANHPTAEQVFLHIHAIWPKLAKGTVYRNLNLLDEAGEISKIAMPNAPTRFDHHTHSHYHLKCKICGKVIDSKNQIPPNLLDTFCENEFDVEGFDLVLSGTCADCKNTQNL